MITSMEIECSENIINTYEYVDHYLRVEVWEDDNTVIKEDIKGGFEFEITKENAIKLAKTILASYGIM